MHLCAHSIITSMLSTKMYLHSSLSMLILTSVLKTLSKKKNVQCVHSLAKAGLPVCSCLVFCGPQDDIVNRISQFWGLKSACGQACMLCHFPVHVSIIIMLYIVQVQEMFYSDFPSTHSNRGK